MEELENFEYKVISKGDLDEFNKEVNEYLKIGWRLRGGLKVSNYGGNNWRLYSQVLIRQIKNK